VKTNRLEAFSDGVIAIIITIMVLDLKAPHDPTFVGLLKVMPVLLSYVLSFLIVAVYWVNHHHLIHLARGVDGPTLWANINLLFWLSLFPWVTSYLGENPKLTLPVALYCGVTFACAIAFYILRTVIATRHRNDEKFRKVDARMEQKNRIALVVYAFSIVFAFVYTPVALVLVAMPALMYFMPDRHVEDLSRE
jgi:uncharacterized membrane protein